MTTNSDSLIVKYKIWEEDSQLDEDDYKNFLDEI